MCLYGVCTQGTATDLEEIVERDLCFGSKLGRMCADWTQSRTSYFDDGASKHTQGTC